MNYSHIIEDMCWSYSRITTYEDCPYKFFLKYIRKVKGARKFFAEYGSFMHLIIQKYFNGELQKDELIEYYLENFRMNVFSTAPNKNIFQNYFSQGIDYLLSIEKPEGEIIGVEKEVNFYLKGRNFIGYIDLVTRNNGIAITDNKSRALKPRSSKGKYTNSDLELDKYLRQLYIYSIPIEKEFKELPNMLCFNCYRTQTQIYEPFKKEVYESVKEWAVEMIDKISLEEEWNPNIDYFKCRNLCDVSSECEYYQMF